MPALCCPKSRQPGGPLPGLRAVTGVRGWRWLRDAPAVVLPSNCISVGSAGRVPRTGRGFGARLCRGRLLASSTSACPPQQRWPCSLGSPPFFSLALKEHVENSPSSTCFSMNLQVPPKVKFSGSLKAFFISPHFQKDFRWLSLHRNKRNIKGAGRPVRTGR